MTEVQYRDASEIRDVVERFEGCDFALAEFTHARHLTVACWYLCSLTREEALERMRCGLQSFIAHHGKQGYHETITRFWMELLANYLGQLPAIGNIDLQSERCAATVRQQGCSLFFLLARPGDVGYCENTLD